MAAKKNLNKPNKPAMKERSTKAPARKGSEVSKLTRKSSNGFTYASNGKDRPVASFDGQSKSTKKVVQTEGVSKMFSTPTKKGTQLAANKSARAKKGN